MNRSTVLIVDDNRDLAENLGEVLGDEGYTCAIAYDADSAIAQLDRMQFDFVITDLRMTPRDGLAVVAAVRRQSLEIPIVLMTAFAGEVQIEIARAAGVSEVLAKPVDSERLVAFVRERIPLLRA